MKKYEEELDIPMTNAQKVLEVLGDILFYALIVCIIVGAVMFASSRTRC